MSTITVAGITIQPANVATVAGDGTYWHRFSGPALTAEFADPDGIAVDGAGNIYVSDTENSSVQVVDHQTGFIITIAGGTGVYGYNGDNISATAAYLSYPRAIAIDGTGNVYIADQPNGRVREILASSFARAFTSGPSTGMVVGTPTAFAVTTNYWPTPALTMVSQPPLPSGIVFTDNGNGTGSLGGTPGAGTNGIYTLTFYATDSLFPQVAQTFQLTIYPSGGGPATSTATPVATDTVTSGNWQGTYGGDGYSLAGVPSQFIPSYASLTGQAQETNIWFSPNVSAPAGESQSDPRALQIPGSTSRILGTWESDSAITFDVNITDGHPHLISLYALDWDYRGRLEEIQIQDAASGFLLYSATDYNFTNGTYLAWNITGHVHITVTLIGGLSASVSGVFFGGNAPTVPLITQEPQDAAVSIGSTATFAVVASGGGLTYQWESQGPGASSFSPIAGATSNSYTTSAIALAGTGTQFKCVVTNNLGSTPSNAATVTVLIPASITITPSNPSVLLGQSVTFVATGTYAGGGTQDVSSQVTWGSSNTAAVTVNSSGLAAAVGMGSSTITATELNVVGSTLVAVPSLSSISVSPTNPVVPVGGTQQFNATGTYQNGVTEDISSAVSWGSSNNGVVTVNGSGLATVSGAGNTTISASVNGVVGNTILSTPPILSQPSGLVLYWTFNATDSGYGTELDRSGNGGNGTIHGTPAEVQGRLSQAMSFNGVNSYVSMGESSDPSTSFLNSVTLVAWINTSNASRFESIISKYDATGGGWGYIFRTDGSGFLEMFLGGNDVQGSNVTAVDTTKINDGQWHHVVAVVTIGQGVSFYVDGNYSSATTLKITPSGDNLSNLNVALNTFAVFGNFFTGSIDEVRAYNRALTASEVNTVYQISGGAPPGPLTSIVLTPANPTIVAGGTLALTATGTYQGGSTQNITSEVSWSSGTTGVATISGSGGVTGISTGTSTITGTLSGISGQTVVSVGANPTSASFVKTDMATEGSWKGVYGSSGYNVITDTVSYPANVTVTPSGQQSYQWASSTTDVRALQQGVATGRVAGTWYSATQFTVDLQYSDTTQHQIAAYLMDWDSNVRTETVTVMDGGSNAILDTRMLASFHGGTYLVWNVSGHVKLQFTNTNSASNAVVSGLFFDPVGGIQQTVAAPMFNPAAGAVSVGQQVTISTATAGASIRYTTDGSTPSETAGTVYNTAVTVSSAETIQAIAYEAGMTDSSVSSASYTISASGNSASFVKADTTTQGSWKGIYGASGYNVITNTVAYPANVTVTPSGQQSYQWAASTTDVRALQQVSGTGRVAGTWYSPTQFTVDVQYGDAAQHQIAAYLMDWDSNARTETVTVMDASSSAVLDTRILASFHGGTYLVWNVTGHVKLQFTNTGSVNAVLSGLFFDPPGGSPQTNAAQFVKFDTTTQGNWQGVYGADGFNIINDTVQYPGYATVTPSGQSSWTWAGSSGDVRALQKKSVTNDRIAAAWYSGSAIGNSFSININLTDGNSHQIAIYCVDWDAQGRSETIEILDPNGALLDSRNVSSFSALPEYLVWNVQGHVTIKVILTSGINAVASGVFFK